MKLYGKRINTLLDHKRTLPVVSNSVADLKNPDIVAMGHPSAFSASGQCGRVWEPFFHSQSPCNRANIYIYMVSQKCILLESTSSFIFVGLGFRRERELVSDFMAKLPLLESSRSPKCFCQFFFNRVTSGISEITLRGHRQLWWHILFIPGLAAMSE